VQKLVNGGRYAVNLAAPAPLEAGPSLFSLHGVRLELIGGMLSVDEVRWAEGQLQTSGSAQGLSLAYVQNSFGAIDAVSTDLKLTGDWSISAGTAVNGKLTIRRESGDVLILSEPKLPLKIENLELTLNIEQNRVRAQFAGFSRAGGTLNVDLQTVLEKRAGTWGVAGTAPLDLEARADLPSMPGRRCSSMSASPWTASCALRLLGTVQWARRNCPAT
jgi:translocation and assembly module TamB